MKKLVYVFGDDWNALYSDGELAFEGHDTLSPAYIDALRAAGVDLVERFADMDWLMDEGEYPRNLADVVQAADL